MSPACALWMQIMGGNFNRSKKKGGPKLKKCNWETKTKRKKKGKKLTTVTKYMQHLITNLQCCRTDTAMFEWNDMPTKQKIVIAVPKRNEVNLPYNLKHSHQPIFFPDFEWC